MDLDQKLNQRAGLGLIAYLLSLVTTAPQSSPSEAPTVSRQQDPTQERSSSGHNVRPFHLESGGSRNQTAEAKGRRLATAASGCPVY